MLDTELNTRLVRLLAGKVADPARAAALITAKIRHLHPIAHAATAIAQGRVRTPAGLAPAVGLHGLGAVSTEGVGSAAAGAKAGATVGSVIPIVGTVVGAVVGAIAGYLIGSKKYINVNSDNAEEDQDVLDIWPQYRKIAGQVAGRDIGMPLLERIWRGATYSGSDFPLNNGKKCFHAGCLKYPGNPDWIHGHMFGGSGAKGFPAQLNQAGGMSPAQFVDQVFIPAQHTDRPPWAVPSTPAGRQVLIDIADALMAPKGVPYTYGTPQQSAALPQALAPPAPTLAPAPGTVSMPGYAPPQTMIATTPGTSSDQLLAAFLAQQGIAASSPQGQQLIRDVSATGVQPTLAGMVAGVPQWMLLAGAALAVGMALAHPAPARSRAA